MKVYEQQKTIKYRGKVPVIVSFSGKLESGKDTARKMLSYIMMLGIPPENMTPTHYEEIKNWDVRLGPDTNKTFTTNECGTWTIGSFAYAMKAMCSIAVFGEIREEVFTNEIKNLPVPNPGWSHMTWREFFQWFGTKVARKGDKQFWIKSFTGKLFTNKERDIKTMMTDTRFKNEAWFCNKTQNCLSVRIDRNEDVVDPNDETIPKINRAESEIDLDNWKKFHEIVKNHGTFEEFYALIWNLAIKYKLIHV